MVKREEEILKDLAVTVLLLACAEANAKTVPMLKTGTVFGAQPCGFAAKEYGKTIFVC